MNKKKVYTKNIADDVLNDLIKFNTRNTWFSQAVAEDMGRRTGSHYFRQEISMWLNSDAKKRTEPRLGAGLLLLEVGNSIIELFKKEHENDPKNK